MDNKKRTAIQAIAALIQNANFKGFFTGKIYQGQVKNVCVPGLNCYSCPGAVGACPIGSIQSFLSGFRFKLPYYVFGLVLFFGVILGRAVCGLLCPFGFLQDLLSKIPFPKKIKTFKGDKVLRFLKYFVLIFTVIILPSVCRFTPFFCKYICPSGTLAGILLAFSDTQLFQLFSTTFMWKACILAVVILASVVISRPFCKYLCPLGAIYGLLNKVSILKMRVDKDKCTGCGACKNVCPMNVNPAEHPNSCECIRCGRCVDRCQADALKLGVLNKTPSVKNTGEAEKKTN